MLYLCATPIGNLEDLTLRVIRVLGEADVIFAEDTRRTLQLLNHLNIKKPLYSCHAHNEREKSADILAHLQQGKQVALVSDAGMPGISDPGYEVVQAVIAAGLEYTVLPGASAALCALVLSGLPAAQFTFAGFLPRDKKNCLARLDDLQTLQGTLIFYESPLRIKATLQALKAAFGERNACVCRELTKMYEQCVRGTLSELIEVYQQPPRGECVLLVQGCEDAPKEVVELPLLLAKLHAMVQSGTRAKQAAKALACGDISANALYRAYLESESST